MRLYNASTAPLCYLQAPPSQYSTAFAGGGHVGVPVGELGGDYSRTYTKSKRVKKFDMLKAWDEGKKKAGRPPLFAKLYPLPSTKLMRIVIFTMNCERTEFTYLQLIDDCRVGKDVVLLEGMLSRGAFFGSRKIIDGNVLKAVLDVLDEVI